jgi:sialate O-acetylesterase
MNRLLLLFAAIATAASLHAEVKLNSLFCDNAVLQQGMAVPVWGTAGDGEQVTVKFAGQTIGTTAKEGRWMIPLRRMKAGGPYTMTVKGENEVTLTNILVGEVWLCSGQSNMEFPLSRAANAGEAIDAAADPQLRLFTVPRAAVDEPKKDAGGKWLEARPQTVSNFSAVAYFFGRDLRAALKVPVGLIHSSVGGTPAEAWTSHATLETNPDLKDILARYAESIKKYDPAKAAADHQADLEKHREAVATAKAEGKKAPATPRAPEDLVHSLRRPAGLYNGMIAPLEPYAIAGVIWYQGESNNGHPAEYRKSFPAMIRNWRQAWGQGEFPFLFVQIAPNHGMSPELREAQLQSWQETPRTAMAVITDVGEDLDIHPTKKEPVGKRLALAARAIAYGEKVEYSGPVYDSLRIDGNKAILSFRHVGSGLVAEGGDLKGFTIAGEDGKFVPAMAKIEGEKIIVSSPEVSKPAAVRYGWTNTPDVNLYNREGLPATPFRSEMR